MRLDLSGRSLIGSTLIGAARLVPRPRALKQLVGWSLIEVASLFGFCQVPTVSFMAWIRWNGCTNAVLLTTNKLYVMAPGGIP